MLNLDDRLIRETLPTIKPNGLAVLLVISIHLNKESGTCFPSHDRLMKMTGLGSESVYNALKALKKEGILISTQSIDSKHKTFSRRTFKVNTDYIGIFVSAKNAPELEIEPLTDLPYAATPHAVEPDAAKHETYLLNELERLNELEQLNNVGENTPPPAENFNDLKAEIPPPPKVAAKGSAPSEAAAPGCYACAAGIVHKAGPDCDHYEASAPDLIIKSIRPETPNVTEVEAFSMPAAAKQDVVLDPYSYPNAKTAMELQERMRAYFMMYPDEWLVNVLHNAKVSDWPEEKTEGCVLKFCLYKEKVNDLRRTFNQFRADLTLWFIEERARFARSNPSNTTYAPTNQKANLNRLGSDAAAYREKPLF